MTPPTSFGVATSATAGAGVAGVGEDTDKLERSTSANSDSSSPSSPSVLISLFAAGGCSLSSSPSGINVDSNGVAVSVEGGISSMVTPPIVSPAAIDADSSLLLTTADGADTLLIAGGIGKSNTLLPAATLLLAGTAPEGAVDIMVGAGGILIIGGGGIKLLAAATGGAGIPVARPGAGGIPGAAEAITAPGAAMPRAPPVLIAIPGEGGITPGLAAATLIGAGGIPTATGPGAPDIVPIPLLLY